jgi:hypothetical protein
MACVMEILAWKVMRGPGSWISCNYGANERAWVMDILTWEVMRGPGSRIS